jgi:hypothetical protein
VYCTYFMWCVYCTVVVVACFVMCRFLKCGCFDICVGVLVLYVLVFTVFCIVSFVYIFSYLFFCTSLRTIATE